MSLFLGRMIWKNSFFALNCTECGCLGFVSCFIYVECGEVFRQQNTKKLFKTVVRSMHHQKRNRNSLKWWRLLFRSLFPCLGMFKLVMQPTCREGCVQHFVCILVCLLTKILRLRNLQSQLKASLFQLRKRLVYLAYNVLTMIAIYWALPQHG